MRQAARPLQARTVNEVVKAQANKVRWPEGTGGSAAGHRPRFQAGALERDAWLNWPARISARWRQARRRSAHDARRLWREREHLQVGEMRREWTDGGMEIRRREIERAWREGLTPDPLLTVSEWSDRHRMLSSKASAEPGAGAPAARRT
jgi:hypothetical protein